jgi:alkyl sulfatase BDS1-like metallo-beta-lactamase superfamily hydrolase
LAKAFATGKSLPDQARAALAEKDYQWCAELTRDWTRIEPESKEARSTLAACFEALGAAQTNANARNYYLTQAMEWRGEIEIVPPDPSRVPDDFMDALPVDAFLHAMAVRLDPAKALDANVLAQFSFTDISEDYTVHVRHGVAEVRKRTIADPNLKITTTAKTWKRVASKKSNPAMAFASGEISVDGGVTKVVEFLGYFQ